MDDYGDRDMMVICAFRYCLGRRTYVVSECVAWLIRAWDKLDAKARVVIERDLLEEIKRDDDARAEGGEWHPLGMDCDRADWLRLRDFIVDSKWMDKRTG